MDAVLFAMVADMAGAPREPVDTATGEIAGRVSQSLYGRRTWRGTVSSPLLFAGQYEDAESGWAYTHFRFYDPVGGVYGAQDPLGVGPKIASAQGYVEHAAGLTDPRGLKGHPTGGTPHNVTELSPDDVRFSQSTIRNPTDYVEEMSNNGWTFDHVDAVRMPDGGLTLVDNTRLYAARMTDTPVQENIPQYDDAIGKADSDRFFPRGKSYDNPSHQEYRPQTWGEAGYVL